MRALVYFVLLAILTATSVHAEKRVALVIGNSNYKLVSALDNPQNDAALIASTLKDFGFDIITAENANRRSMARAIRAFGIRLRDAGPQAVGLFYYAGHGVQAGGTNYLIPLGAPVADEADLEIEAVSASWVLGQMKSAGNALNLVILDACRNNPFKGAFRSATRGLARMNAPSGSLIAYAAAPGQLAADGESDNSPYTAALVAAMREPGLPLERVFKRVRVAVETATAKKQTPWEESSLRGEFYFIPKAAPKTASIISPKTPTGLTPEMLFWQTVKDSKYEVDFRSYLKRFPDGLFADLAKTRLASLTAVTQAPAKPPAAPTQPTFVVSELDETLMVLKAANVRSGPATSFNKVGRLANGASVEVTGKVQGRRWYRVAFKDVKTGHKTGYVFAALLGELKQEAKPRRTASNKVESRKSKAAKLAKRVIEMRKEVIETRKEIGRARRGWLGVRIQTVSKELADSLGLSKAHGALVASLIEGGPAEKAKLMVGDVILSFGDKPIEEMRSLPKIVAQTAVGKVTKVVVWRKGKEVNLRVKLGENPSTPKPK